MEFAERDVGPADVGGAGLGEEAGLEDHRGEPHGGLRGGGVEGGDADEVPEGLDGPRGLPVAAEPGGEVDAVEGRVGGVELLQGERGPADGGTLGEGEVRVRGEAAREVQRYRKGVAADPAEPGAARVRDVQDGHVQPVLEGSEPGAVDPVEEPPVGGAAAEVHVLAVVDGEVAAAEGEGEAAEAGLGLRAA